LLHVADVIQDEHFEAVEAAQFVFEEQVTGEQVRLGA
jgi:hypothetical protein